MRRELCFFNPVFDCHILRLAYASSFYRMANEADTCRKFVVPKLQAAGWDNEPHSIAEQRSFTDGRIVVRGNKAERQKTKRADYLLRYTRDFPIAVTEAKAEYKKAADGLQQAKEYGEILDLKFAYATNGKEIIEFDFITGIERFVETFPTPPNCGRACMAAQKLASDTVERLLTPFNLSNGKIPHYYQRIVIDRAVYAILGGKARVAHHGHRHRQDRGGVSDLLETLVEQMERQGRSDPKTAIRKV